MKQPTYACNDNIGSVGAKAVELAVLCWVACLAAAATPLVVQQGWVRYVSELLTYCTEPC